MLAAQLSSIGGPVEPDPVFIRDLERRVAAALPDRRATRRRVTRRGFLRSSPRRLGRRRGSCRHDEARRRGERPRAAERPDPGRRRPLVRHRGRRRAAPGAMKPFTAGGLVGYLANDAGELRAVSGICTHMGCRVSPTAARLELRCLCHRSRFDASGRVLEGLPCAAASDRAAAGARAGVRPRNGGESMTATARVGRRRARRARHPPHRGRDLAGRRPARARLAGARPIHGRHVDADEPLGGCRRWSSCIDAWSTSTSSASPSTGTHRGLAGHARRLGQPRQRPAHGARRDGSLLVRGHGHQRRYSFVFRRTGSFSYICTIHPFMHGAVTVRR